MATFSAGFLGCKVSHADAQAVRERLLADGHEEQESGADIAVLNTCCVTHEAISKSRKAASRLARTHDRVYVTGCGANLAGGAFAGLPDNVVVIARRSEETPEAVAGDVGAHRLRPGRRPARPRPCLREGPGRLQLLVLLLRDPARARCVRSRAADAVLAEVRRRVAQGHKEVVLTGINLGCYRDRAAGYKLPRLVREVGAVPGLARLRLSSIEVNHLDEELAAALRETPAVAKHLHVPLQSGCDDVLRAMGRRYQATTFLRRLALVPDFNVTTDVIVGFPAEDERAFRRTLSVVADGRRSRRCTCSRTRRDRGRERRATTPCRRRSRRSGAPDCAHCRASSRSAAGARRSAARTSFSSTAPGSATATTTRRGSSTRPSASSSRCAAPR